ncbi:PREDICTED: adenosine deaminase CECR1-like [Rhagoletis zephyria]|uniref:adenosine deaminase CECR1-like n=1 Tax=Rhagoletis zephyria TaxID=28612 RepID=UPI0008116009|nr:PREDICTED: adenosine deaminase CECR1-like [Rhagoletis zephyria]
MMSTSYLVTIISVLQLLSYADTIFISYEDARKAVIQAEDQLIVGARIHLNDVEDKVNDMFMRYKYDELGAGFYDPDVNAAGLHFFKGKKLVEQSKVLKFLKRMPKGAILHLHNTASVSSEWMVRNISYMPGLLRCTNKEGTSILSFRRTARDHGCATQYVRVSDERARSLSPATYDRSFEKLINLYTPVPEYDYPTIKHVWRKFQNMFATTNDALRYLPAFRAYSWRMLEEMYEDNVMYAELRMDFKELYDYSGRTFSPERTVHELLTIVEDFRRQYPSFMGVKAIFSTHRDVERSRVSEKFKKFKSLHKAHTDFIIGFDLVGQEDRGKPLHNFVAELADLPRSAKYFFHAGETNWYGAATDMNLLDALLLNTTRIGHGYALLKHPVLWNAVKRRDVAIEVSPISNQVLHLVTDLRNHPASFYMSQNLPMVICNDDPGFWGTKGLSYDFYYTIMSLAPNHVGLKTLKGLVWNSIRYSVMNENERRTAFENLEQAWERFVSDVAQGKVF